MQLPNWFAVFNEVCARDRGSLQWGLPEPWVHAELYAELAQQADATGWIPFSTEVPYATFYPVRVVPSQTGTSAIKWVDLCLKSRPHNAWCWFEFKVRHTGSPDRRRKAALEARDAFRKDVVSLVGFDAQGTANTWRSPDNNTKAYWFEEHLAPHVDEIRSGEHHFVAAFLQLDGELDQKVWGEQVLTAQIRSWFSYRNRSLVRQNAFPPIRTETQRIAEKHWLLTCSL
jgi:hypothetical protein